MIIQPDFLDHWKTQLLINELDDPMAPLYLIRLWAHCQNRKTNRFERVNQFILKSICKAPHDCKKFEKAMVDAGFVRVEDGFIVAHDWDVVNAYLVNCWDNGKKGGRPKKKTHGLTHAKPTGNPRQTPAEPIREEKIREDGKKDSVERGSVVTDSKPSALKDTPDFYSKDFSLFWDSYPKKTGKGGAFTAWKRAKQRLEASVIVESVERHKLTDDWRKDGGQYIPHPQTWLNQRCWEDEFDTKSSEAPTLEEMGL